MLLQLRHECGNIAWRCVLVQLIRRKVYAEFGEVALTARYQKNIDDGRPRSQGNRQASLIMPAAIDTQHKLAAISHCPERSIFVSEKYNVPLTWLQPIPGALVGIEEEVEADNFV